VARRDQCKQPDGAGTQDGDRFADQVPRKTDGVHRRGQGFDERSLVVAESRGYLVQPARWDRKNVRHTTFSVAAAEELQVFTQVLGVVPTGLAVAAYKGRLYRNPLTGHDLVHTVGDGHHHAYHFMAGVVRGLEKSVLAMGAGLVRAAHSRHQHLDEGFARLEVRHRLSYQLDNVGGADKDSSTVKLTGHGLSIGCDGACHAGSIGRLSSKALSILSDGADRPQPGARRARETGKVPLYVGTLRRDRDWDRPSRMRRRRGARHVLCRARPKEGPEATSRAWLEATRQKRLGPAEDIGHTRLLRCC